MMAANRLSYRRHALRYMVMITDAGVHERTDDTECSNATLAETQAALDPATFAAVVHPNLGAPDGVHPRRITDALGGLLVTIGSSPIVDFDVSRDTSADDVLANAAVVTCAGAGDASEIQLTTTVDGTEHSQVLAID
jgi:hypothetical protein